MTQIFSSAADTWLRLFVVGGLCAAAGGLAGVIGFARSDYYSGARIHPPPQPVPFSHRHHVSGLGLDCRFCHTAVAEGPRAGLPPTYTCMTCHSQIWTNAAMLEPVRASYRDDKSLSWTRVNALPEFVYFDHGIHVAKGVGCTTCHGPIAEMPLTWREGSLYMSWCLNCHRQPEQFVRPKAEIFNPNYVPPANQLELGRRLVKEYKIQSLTSCYTCHR